MAQHRNVKTIAWSALIVAIIALVLALLAFTQSSGDTTETNTENTAPSTIEMRSDFQATEDELQQENTEPIETVDATTTAPEATDTE